MRYYLAWLTVALSSLALVVLDGVWMRIPATVHWLQQRQARAWTILENH